MNKIEISKKIKQEYGIENNAIISRLITIQSFIKNKRHEDISYNELIEFIKESMNSDDMQIWLIRNQLKDIKVSFTDELKKFFELNKSNEDILRLYDRYKMLNENRNTKNIESIRQELKKVLKK